MKKNFTKAEDYILSLYYSFIINLDAAIVIAWLMIMLSVAISLDPHNNILQYIATQASIPHDFWQYIFLVCGLIILGGNMRSGLIAAFLCFPFASFLFLLTLHSLFTASFMAFSTGILLTFLIITLLFFARSPVYRKLREQNVLLNLKVIELQTRLDSIPEGNHDSNG